MSRKAHPKPLRSPTTGASRAILNNGQNFTISGGTFTIQANTSDLDESVFRRVRLGDLRLVKEVAKQNIVEYHEVRHKRTGVVKRRVPKVVGLREIYRAHIHGSQEEFTAVVYQGSDFEKHRAHAERRENFRHPSLVQLFGVTSGKNLKALIYHDRLMPLDEFREMHQQSLLVSAFLENEMNEHFHAALAHWLAITGALLVVQDSYNLWTHVQMGTTLWICFSTGQLCIEVNDNQEHDPTRIPQGLLGASISSRVHLTSHTNLEETLLSHLSLDDVHRIFSTTDRWSHIDLADPGTVLLGSLSWPTSSYAPFSPFSEISLSNGLGLLDVDAEICMYTRSGSASLNEDLVLLPNGWTRVGLKDLPIHNEHDFHKNIYPTQKPRTEIRKCWLSQVNHVMDKSGLDADEYFVIEQIHLHFSIYSDVDHFTLRGTFMADTSRDDIYLFLFPANVDDSGGHLAVHLAPEDATYYWSFDPYGIERLPQDTSEELALPHVNFLAQVYGFQWSEEICESITQVHRTKGFDPIGQDVAIKLGHPLVDVDRLINLIYYDAIEVVDDEVESEA